MLCYIYIAYGVSGMLMHFGNSYLVFYDCHFNKTQTVEHSDRNKANI
jgi:hypothetical protein